MKVYTVFYTVNNVNSRIVVISPDSDAAFSKAREKLRGLFPNASIRDVKESTEEESMLFDDFYALMPIWNK